MSGEHKKAVLMVMGDIQRMVFASREMLTEVVKVMETDMAKNMVLDSLHSVSYALYTFNSAIEVEKCGKQ